MDFHLTISTRMATHLRLAFNNTCRTQWLAGGLLSTNAAQAQETANLLHDHLVRVQDKYRTAFETAFLSDRQMMLELDLFRQQSPPALLWGHQGRFAALYRCLAPRFLANPDTVLGCEGVHSRWQWYARLRRNCSIGFINGCLRLQWRLHEGGGMPPNHELLPHFREVRTAVLLEYRLWMARAAAHGAQGQSANLMWAERFNLTVEDALLLKAAKHGSSADVPTKETAWSSYCRQVVHSISLNHFVF